MTSAWRKAVEASVNFITQLQSTAKVRHSRTDSAVGVGEYVLSMSSFIPCTISLALCRAVASASGAFGWYVSNG